MTIFPTLLLRLQPLKHLLPLPSELKISPHASKVPTSPVSKKNPFVSRNRYKAGGPGLPSVLARRPASVVSDSRII